MNNFFVPRVAVCMAAYNGMVYIKDQIESTLLQKDVDVHIFVSIDKSSDGTEDMLAKWVFSEPRLTILPVGKYFGGAGPNFYRLLRDVNISDFDYVSFADQDDIWYPEKLWRAHQIILSTKSDAYSSNVMAFWPDGRKALIEKSQKQVQWDFLFEAAGPGCTYVMRKELACAIQGVLKNRWADVQQVGLHDWFVYAFARSNGYRWVIDDYPGMLYRQHEKNQVGVNKGWRALMHRARKICSGWGLSQSALIADLVGLGNDPFVKRWSGGSRIGMLWLACHAGQCRRRLRDKWLFALSCLVLAIVGKRQP